MMFSLDDRDGALYSADGHMNRDSFDNPLFSFEGNVLHCTGIIPDRIKFILDDAPEIPVGTVIPSCDPESNWRFRCWSYQIGSCYQKNKLETYQDPIRSAWVMFHGDNAATWPQPAESGYDPEIYHPNEQYVCLPSLSRHVLRWASSYDRTAAWGLRRRCYAVADHL